MAGEGIGAYLVCCQRRHTIPFVPGQPDGVLIRFPDVRQSVTAAPAGVGLDAVGGDDGVVTVGRLGNNQSLPGPVHHPVAGDVVTGAQQIKQADHRHTGRPGGEQLAQPRTVQLHQTGGAGGSQQTEHPVGGAVIVKRAEDHGKIGAKPAQKQNHRPDQRSPARLLGQQQDIQGGKHQQKRQGIIPQHIQAVEKAHRIFGQERGSVGKIICPVVIAGSQNQDGKTNQCPDQPGDHPGGDPLFLPGKKGHAEHQTDQ